MSSSLYLLYRSGFAPTNGTSVQLARLLTGRENDIIHLMWDIGEAGDKSVPATVVADDSRSRPWPFPRGNGVYATLRKWLQFGWWGGGKVGQAKLRRHLARFPLKPTFAYVICMKEWDARRITSLWKAIGRPRFVLHIMDILHQEISASDTPHFFELVRRAEHVVCISSLIEAEAQRCGARRTSILPCTTTFTARKRTPLAGPLRIVITGRIWFIGQKDNPSLTFLENAWPEIVRLFPGAELHYAGSDGHQLPPTLRIVAINHGLIPPAACQQLLQSCRLAYLPVSYPSHTVTRFSVPSRLADFLACGLPTIVCTEDNSGIMSFMRAVPVACWKNITDAADLVKVVVALCGSQETWSKASQVASRYALNELQSEVVGARLFQLIDAVRIQNARTRMVALSNAGASANDEAAHR